MTHEIVNYELETNSRQFESDRIWYCWKNAEIGKVSWKLSILKYVHYNYVKVTLEEQNDSNLINNLST